MKLKDTKLKLSICSALALTVLLLGAWTASAEVTITIKVSPQSISMDSSGEWLSVYANVPFSIVDPKSLVLNETLSARRVLQWKDGYTLIRFRVSALKEILSGPGTYQLTLKGNTVTGDEFSGTDTIRVVEKK